MEENENDIELLSVWADGNEKLHSTWHARNGRDVMAIVIAIVDFARQNDDFMLLLLGALSDCVKGGELSRYLEKSSIDISNFNNILKNTQDNG